ncbi:helix-turn-helix domain-containing protein [Burkholderia cenocepacia]|uniref:helix-turn-helix domain-containing protein n=1 Tax=Burkholderia cenocepacia TaxID=95486 RepID=UPI002B24FFB2|nr:helix-turn-helix transcriptional regulator [Burkholderia cenocepacia]MEB2554090.1 helix-turn-helix transcriptional regulator [Burkholderia cenocepacia]
MKLGELLKSRREALGMTLDDVADATGSSKSYVWELEAGRSYKMGLPLAARFAVALGLQVSMMAAAALESEANAARTGASS